MLKKILYALAIVAVSILPVHAQLSAPEGLGFDSGGNLWVADFGNNNVLELNPTTGVILRTITSGIDGPTRLALDSKGNLYVCNATNNAVTIYNSSGSLLQTITGFKKPLGIAVDAYGDFYVANNQASDISAYNAAKKYVETLTKDSSGTVFDAPGALGINGTLLYVAHNSGAVTTYNVGNFLTDDPIESTKFSNTGSDGPDAIAFDASGNVYVSYGYSNNVVKYSPSGAKLLSFSTNATFPEGLAIDKSGNIYVGNTGSDNHIGVYSPSGQHLRNIPGGGTSTLINFDTTPGGAAIANNTVIDNTYASDGVTFKTVPCPSNVPNCITTTANAFAVSSSTTAASQPNVVSTLVNTFLIQMQWGGIQANFPNGASSASIEVVEECIGQDLACLVLVPTERAFLAAYDSQGNQIAHEYATGALGSKEVLTITAPTGKTISFVQFTVPYDSAGNGANQLGGSFDNLSFAK